MKRPVWIASVCFALVSIALGGEVTSTKMAHQRANSKDRIRTVAKRLNQEKAAIDAQNQKVETLELRLRQLDATIREFQQQLSEIETSAVYSVQKVEAHAHTQLV